MEPQRQLVDQSHKPELPNPARKWLFVSAVGLAVCLISLGFYFFGGSTTPYPLPPKVIKQVFGFTPYYFKKDIPPDRLVLKQDSPTFIGNALTFVLSDSKKESITVTEAAAPEKAKAPEGKAETTALGTALIKTGGGRISSVLTTSSKTNIMLEGSDYISADTLVDIYNSLEAVKK